MKTLKYYFAIGILLSMFSCVGSKKYSALKSKYENSVASQKACETLADKQTALNDVLIKQNKDLNDQVEYLKKNSFQTLNALQDMSVLSSKQAESLKQSVKTLSENNTYIKNLQAAINHKDSLNMQLVMNLKGSLSDINDKDINIKVEKGVVYIDLSDKLLFNSGEYTVTEKAKSVLEKISNILNAHSELDVMVEGHTDSIPFHNSVLVDNWDLSVKRATSVVRVLEKQYKIDPNRMTAAGHSKYFPVTSNLTADGRALNRRTTIIILPQLDQFFKLLLKKQ